MADDVPMKAATFPVVFRLLAPMRTTQPGANDFGSFAAKSCNTAPSCTEKVSVRLVELSPVSVAGEVAEGSIANSLMNDWCDCIACVSIASKLFQDLTMMIKTKISRELRGLEWKGRVYSRSHSVRFRTFETAFCRNVSLASGSRYEKPVSGSNSVPELLLCRASWAALGNTTAGNKQCPAPLFRGS